jgi:trk system potassium uptake protein
VLALINRRAYVDLVQADRIDIAISPAQVSIGSLLAHVRRGDVAAVHSLRRGPRRPWSWWCTAIRPTQRSSAGGSGELDLPRGVTVGAMVRGERPRPGGPDRRQVLIAHHDTVIEAEDHVILFLIRKDLVPKVERYFQVGIGFF